MNNIRIISLGTTFLLSFILGLPAAAIAQVQDKRPLEHEDYDHWNTISGTTVSRDGKWLIYTLRDGKANQTLKVRSFESEKEYTIKHGAGVSIAFDGKHVAYRVVPAPELLKKLKKEEKPKELLPKEKFEILELDSGETITMDAVTRFAMPEENGDWIAFRLEQSEQKAGMQETKAEPSEKFAVTPEGLKRPGSNKNNNKEKNKKSEVEEKESESKNKELKSEKEPTEASRKKEKAVKKVLDEKKEKKKDGSVLVVRNLKTGVEKRIPLVTSFQFDETGTSLAYVTSSKENGDLDSVVVLDLNSGESNKLLHGLGNYRNLAFNKQGNQLAFVTDRDDYSTCLLYTSPSPRDATLSRMPSSA